MEDPAVSTLSIVLAVVLGGVLLIMCVQQLYSGYSSPASKSRAPLPRGSFGWPIVGESLDYVRDPKEFTHSRVKRYGSVFKTSILRRQTIAGTTPKFAKFVSSNAKLFRSALPKQMEEMIGPKALLFQDGPRHMSIKKLVLKAVGPEALRNQVDVFETIILENLASWERAGIVNGTEAAQKLTWDTSNWVLFGDRDVGSSGALERKRLNFENFKKLLRAASSLPLKFPGTTYGRGIKAKAALLLHFHNLIQQSKIQKTNEGVFFQALLAARDDPEGREELKELDDDTLADNILFINFAAYDTTSRTLIFMLKFLVDYPDVFRRIRAEQEEILKSKNPSVEGPRLTWEDTRNMVYTKKFFQEVQRYISIIPSSVREATEELEFEGQLIPKGWLVRTMLKFIHSDPANYPDLSFNPDRFDVAPKPYTYIPFSAGTHMCPGIEVAKLTTCIAIHHLTTTYIYESLAPDMGEEYEGLFPRPRGGYPIKVQRRNN